ncbi:MAG: hypothetical protein R3C19_09880 [Planctomycetaceae bacterium]
MHTEPKRRFASVQEFQQAVRQSLQHEESRRLTMRADELIAGTSNPNRPVTYEVFQEASALYVEANREWPENAAAVEGLRAARLQYAELAQSNGDYDLGLQIAAKHDSEEFQDLRRSMKTARRVRSGIKWTALLASIAVVIAVGFSSYQARKIVGLNENVDTLTAKKKELESNNEQLSGANSELKTSNQQLTKANESLVATKTQLQADVSALHADNATLQSDNSRLIADKSTLERQNADLTQDNTQLAKDNTQLGQDNASLELQKLNALFELRNSGIHSAVRNGDYPQALTETEQLLHELRDGDLRELPDNENERIRELETLRQDLRQRAVENNAPLLSLAVSPGGDRIAWSDAAGQVSLRNVTPERTAGAEAPDVELRLPADSASMQFSDNGSRLFVLAGRTLLIREIDRGAAYPIESPDEQFTDLEVSNGIVIASTSAGTMTAWAADSREPVWTIRGRSPVDDLTLVPDSGLLIAAGSRGAQSADVLAFRLPDRADPSARPVRLGQLRIPRESGFAVYRVAASPDGRLLFLSNRNDGRLLVLPRRRTSDTDSPNDVRGTFPFQHVTELAGSSSFTWQHDHHTRPISDIAFSADGRVVATASDDRTIGIWTLAGDVSTDSPRLEFVKRLEGHGAAVTAVRFLDSGGQYLCSASADRYCRFWNLATYDADRKRVESHFDVSLTRPAGVNRPHYRLTSANDEAADALADDAVVFNSGHRIQQGAIASACLSRDGRYVVTGASDGTAVIWHKNTGSRDNAGRAVAATIRTQRELIDEGHDYYIRRAMFVPPDGQILVTTGYDGTLCLWNTDDRQTMAGTQRLRMTGLDLVNAVGSSPDGRLLLTSSAKDPRGDPDDRDTSDNDAGTCDVWKLDDLLNCPLPKPLLRLTGTHKRDVTAIAVAPSGRLAATGAADGLVAVWQLDTGELRASAQLHGKDTFVTHLQWLTDDRLFTAGLDGKLQICDVTPAAQPSSTSAATKLRDPATAPPPAELTTVLTFDHGKFPVNRVAFAPDLTRFLTLTVETNQKTGTTQSDVRLWSVRSTKPLRSIRAATVTEGGRTNVTSIDWSADGSKTVLVAGGRLQILDTAAWQIESVFDAPRHEISDAVFAPSSPSETAARIVTLDGVAAHLWNLRDRSHIADFRPMFAVSAVALMDDGDECLLLTGDQSVRAFSTKDAGSTRERTRFKISSPHHGIITSIAVNPVSGSRQFASSAADGSVSVWEISPDSDRAKHLRNIDTGGSPVSQVAWSPDGRWLLAVSEHAAAYLYSTKRPDDDAVKIPLPQPQDRESCVLLCGCFSPDGRRIAIGGRTTDTSEGIGWVWNWSPDDDDPLHLHGTLRRQTSGGLRKLAFVPESPYLVTGEHDGAAVIWNWQPDRKEGSVPAYPVFELIAPDRRTAHAAPVTAVDVADGRTILTAGEDGTAILWKNPFADF